MAIKRKYSKSRGSRKIRGGIIPKAYKNNLKLSSASFKLHRKLVLEQKAEAKARARARAKARATVAAGSTAAGSTVATVAADSTVAGAQ